MSVGDFNNFRDDSICNSWQHEFNRMKNIGTIRKPSKSECKNVIPKRTFLLKYFKLLNCIKCFLASKFCSIIFMLDALQSSSQFLFHQLILFLFTDFRLILKSDYFYLHYVQTTCTYLWNHSDQILFVRILFYSYFCPMFLLMAW